MTSATPAVADDLAVSSRRSMAALARAPKIPSRTKAATGTGKRAAMVLRRGMRPVEFRQIEDQLAAQGIACLPVVPGQRKIAVADTPLCGLIITGADLEPSAMERDLIEATVREIAARNGAILALSNAAALVLEALNLEPIEGETLGVLVHKGVRVLESAKQVNEAIAQLARSPQV